MADTKTTGLTENTSPLSTDMLYMIDDPGGSPASQKITVANLMTLAPISLVLGGTGFNPADATTYYFGAFSETAPTTAAATRRIYIPRAGTIKTADIMMNCAVGSNEACTLYLRKNNTTDTTLSSTVTFNASPYHELVTGLNITLSASDYIEAKLVCATFGTNPTAVYPRLLLLLY